MRFLKRVAIRISQLTAKITGSIQLSYLYSLYLMKRVGYLEVYRKRMDKQIKLRPEDSRWRPKTDRWDKAGNIQFQCLIQQGLKPEHTLLDIGCGSLRAGLLLIKYLAPGNYTGIDISQEAIKCARQLVSEEGLAVRKPRLLVTHDSRFKEFEGETFGLIWAYDVLFHLPPEEVEEIFRNIGSILGKGFISHSNLPAGLRQRASTTFAIPFHIFTFWQRRMG